MAHMIDMSNNRANMAYVGDTPWHKLGTQLKPDASIEKWQEAAGLDFEIQIAPIQYEHAGRTIETAERIVMKRSDTGAMLGVASSEYVPHQPREILEFYREGVEKSDFTLETAGSLNGGKRIWALARMNREIVLPGKDIVRPFLLLATGTDNYMATHADFTTVRVVCNNTLTAADNEASAIRVKALHRSSFNPQYIKAKLGLASVAFDKFEANAKAMVSRKVSREEAVKYFVDLCMGDKEAVDVTNAKLSGKVTKLLELYATSPGANMKSAKGTAWGLLNAVTRYTDFEARAQSADHRLNAAWFGAAAKMKEAAKANALLLAA